MKFDFLPNRIIEALKNINTDELIELRIRKDFPIVCNFVEGRQYLLDKSNNKNLIYTTKNDIDYIISELTERSYYAYNDRLKQGYLNYKDGTRVGVAGECVFDNENIISIRNISSLNIRFCRNREDCSKKIFEKILYHGQVLNSLIISPPTKGKTTILKDLVLKLNLLNRYSILVIDERGEFCNVKGENIDTISNCTKFYGFSIGIRSMAPEIIVTDEISSRNDWQYLQTAKNSGIKFIATCHGENIEDIRNKTGFNKNLFDRYFILNSIGKPGVVKEVLDGDYLKI